MQPAFDPYYRWLGIPPAEQPADHYRLLGIPQFEPDEEVISNAADARMGFVRTFQSGQHTAESQRILNELSVARVVLLNPSKRQEYDTRLRIAIQKNAPAAPASAVPVAIPAAPAWAFHPPAPGYNGAAPMYPSAPYPQQAPYLQPVTYPQPTPWIAQQQPGQATFVGGALADADAARARAEAEAAAPQIAKSLPPATRRRQSIWRNPWMVAAGGTLLTIIAVFVMVRAGYNAREPDFVDANLPTFTVPTSNVWDEKARTPSGQKRTDEPLDSNDQKKQKATANQGADELALASATEQAGGAIPIWSRAAGAHNEFSVSADDRWIVTFRGSQSPADWSIHDLAGGAPQKNVQHGDSALLLSKPSLLPGIGAEPSAVGLFQVANKPGVYHVGSAGPPQNYLTQISPQALFTIGGEQGEFVAIAADPQRPAVRIFRRESGDQLAQIDDLKSDSVIVGLQARRNALAILLRSPQPDSSNHLWWVVTYSLNDQKKLHTLQTASGGEVSGGFSLSSDGNHMDSWTLPNAGKIRGARTPVVGGGSAVFGVVLDNLGDDVANMSFVYSYEQGTLAVAEPQSGTLRLYKGYNQPPHIVRFPQGLQQVAFVAEGKRLITLGKNSTLALWDLEALRASSSASNSSTNPVAGPAAISQPLAAALPAKVKADAPLAARPQPPNSGSGSVDLPTNPNSKFTREQARAALEAIGMRFPTSGKLSGIGLTNRFTDDHAQYLTAFPEIQGVNTNQAPITGKTIAVVAQLPALKSLGIQRPSSFTDEDLKPLANVQALEQLALIETSVIGPGFEHLAKLEKLRAVQVGPPPQSHEFWKGLGRLKKLEMIPMTGPAFDNSDLACLSELSEIRMLGLMGSKVNGDGYVEIGKHRKLHTLHLPATPAKAEDFKHLSALASLQQLYCDAVAGDDALEPLLALRELRTLSPPRQITDAGLARISGLPNLRDLHLFNCYNVTDAGLTSLAKCENLREITPYPNLGAVGWDNIAKIKNLTNIQAASCTLPAAQAQALANLPKLEMLAIGVTDDETFRQLAKLPAVKVLGVHRAAFSPANIEDLAQMKSLQNLTFGNQNGTDWKDNQVTALKKLTKVQNVNGFGIRLPPGALDSLKQAAPTCNWNGFQ